MSQTPGRCSGHPRGQWRLRSLPYLAQDAELVRESRKGNSRLQSNRSSQTEQLRALPTADAEERADSKKTKPPKKHELPPKRVFWVDNGPKKDEMTHFGLKPAPDRFSRLELRPPSQRPPSHAIHAARCDLTSRSERSPTPAFPAARVNAATSGIFLGFSGRYKKGPSTPEKSTNSSPHPNPRVPQAHPQPWVGFIFNAT
jgi:hypothetical protein